MSNFDRWWHENKEWLGKQSLSAADLVGELIVYVSDDPEVDVEILSSSGGPQFRDEVTKQKKVWLTWKNCIIEVSYTRDS